jgi:hypothetical protein
MSEKLQYDLSKLGIGFVMKKGKTLHSELCKLKIRKKDDEEKNVIYCINCKTCQKKYIGETSQQFCTRKYQHNQDVKNKVGTNAIYLHLKEQKKHKVDWDNAIFLDREVQWVRRKIKESLYINAYDPKDKPEKLMNIEKGLKISACWNQFNSEIRNLVSSTTTRKSENYHENTRARRRKNHC